MADSDTEKRTRLRRPQVLDQLHAQTSVELIHHSAMHTALTAAFAAWSLTHAQIQSVDPVPPVELRIAEMAALMAALIAATNPTLVQWGDLIEVQAFGQQDAAMTLAVLDEARDLLDQAQMDRLGVVAEQAAPQPWTPVALAVTHCARFLLAMGARALGRLPLFDGLEYEDSGLYLWRGKRGHREIGPHVERQLAVAS